MRGVPASATVVIPADLGELSREALTIARGRVVALDARWTDDHRRVETIVTLEAESYLKGAFGPVLQFRVPGGRLGRYRSLLVGAPEFVVGQRVVVFLAARGPDVPFVLGLGQGVFRIVPGAGGWLVTPPAMCRGRADRPDLSAAILRAGRCRSPISSGRSALWRERRNEAACFDRPDGGVDGCACRSGGRVPQFGVRVTSGNVTLKWKGPVRYFVSDTGVTGVSPAALQSTVARAFSTWEAVPTASIAYQFGGVTSALPGADDGRSTLGFLEEPELDRVLASTSFLIDCPRASCSSPTFSSTACSRGLWRRRAKPAVLWSRSPCMKSGTSAVSGIPRSANQRWAKAVVGA